MNFTIELPNGTTNHGDPRLICTPASWRDIFFFYVTNFFIHAATLPTAPGESKREIVFAVLNALFIPGFGALRALRRIVLYPGFRFKLSPLERAAASGALCMVVSDVSRATAETSEKRTPELSPEVDTWATDTFSGTTMSWIALPLIRKIHGVCVLPRKYDLCAVPSGAKLRQAGTSEIIYHPSSEYNVVKVLFSLVQIVAGSITIYRSRGDQITKYGYGSFGLSVVPYVFMSTVNVITSLLGPSFSTMFLVHTPDMTKAREDGGQFEGIVAELIPRSRGDMEVERIPFDVVQFTPGIKLASGIIWIVFSFLAPLAIVGGLSGFNVGEISTTTQRGWIISWIVIGSVSSLAALFFQFVVRMVFTNPISPHSEIVGSVVILFVSVCIVSVFWIPAIGGMVIVGQQLREYGICTRFELD